jgi:uncharacterized protein YcaQ
MTRTLSAAEARRVFLAAQGLVRRRPIARVGVPQFRDYLARQGVLQLDSVNVFARAHYLPIFSRYGPYDRDALDSYLWHSGETFEHWGHEASVMPRSLLPTLHFRMSSSGTWKEWTRGYLDHKRPGLIPAVEAAVKASGPLTAADLEHLAPTERRGGSSWWNTGDVKRALEYLFITGRVAVSSRPHFQRRYDDPIRVWGREAREGAPHADDARQALFDLSLGATGIGTPRDVSDHFRLPPQESHHRALSAVERGLATWIEVESWGEPALLSTDAHDPGRATGAAILSPFDPVCWYRDRLLRMFGMHYRIEIYTPAHKRAFGYYSLPFLLGDQIVGRVDLKADRKAGALLVQSAWREEGTAPGARRRSDDDVVTALATELRLAASWLGLHNVAVGEKGTLASALRDTFAPGE